MSRHTAMVEHRNYSVNAAVWVVGRFFDAYRDIKLYARVFEPTVQDWPFWLFPLKKQANNWTKQKKISQHAKR